MRWRREPRTRRGRGHGWPGCPPRPSPRSARPPSGSRSAAVGAARWPGHELAIASLDMSFRAGDDTGL
ncbi:MAG: hypothetical protein DMF77_03860 [Acidobacteria bacterium]|nr:MAG: hypothetical protein DMF77_03860 [Acidobacteriota bacterium]